MRINGLMYVRTGSWHIVSVMKWAAVLVTLILLIIRTWFPTFAFFFLKQNQVLYVILFICYFI